MKFNKELKYQKRRAITQVIIVEAMYISLFVLAFIR